MSVDIGGGEKKGEWDYKSENFLFKKALDQNINQLFE